MEKLLRLPPRWKFILFAVVDVICVGMGMGVPIFCILFGFVVGWFLVKSITHTISDVQQIFRKVFIDAIYTAGFTLIAMLALWGPFAMYLFDPSKDLAQTGIPLILFEPKASFIGWVVLMILISPFLQLLTTLFSTHLTLLGWMKNAHYDQKAV